MSRVDLENPIHLQQKGLGFGSPLLGPVQLPLTLPADRKHGHAAVVRCHGSKVHRGSRLRRLDVFSCRTVDVEAGRTDVLPLLEGGEQAGVQNVLLRLPGAVSAENSS